jgi:hypothetical protein
MLAIKLAPYPIHFNPLLLMLALGFLMLIGAL